MYRESQALLAFGLLLVLVACSGAAAELQISIVDVAGKPIPDVVFIAKSNEQSPRSAPTTAIMDQMNKEFVPEILVVRTGTPVLFPNSDSVAHQVYSFSPAKRFALPLYRGRQYPPVVFDQPGVVTLGCNIHDHMVGYIVVTDSTHFGQADERGRTTLKNVNAGAYKISAWHPRFNETVPEQSVNIADADAVVSFRLTKSLQPKRSSSNDRRNRDY